MPLFGRPDGEYVKDAPTLRRMIPFLMLGRNEAAVYFEQSLDVENTLAFCKEHSDDDIPLSFFHVLVAGYVRVLALRPKLHQFVSGKRLYRRKHLEISFAVKKEYSDSGGLSTVKVRFEPDDDLRIVAEKISKATKGGRNKEKNHAEKEMALLTSLPRFLLSAIMRLQKTLDYYNLFPNFMIEPDPMYASLFLANLGSLGLDSAYHHLYEYGTIPLFATIGCIKPTPVLLDDGQWAKRPKVIIRYTFDERIADGFYCVKGLELFSRMVENPELLLQPFDQTESMLKEMQKNQHSLSSSLSEVKI